METLCTFLPQTPLRALTLNGLGWIYYVRGDFQEALDLASRLEQIAAEHDDAALFVLACNLRGATFVNMGQLKSSCEWLERGIQKCLELRDAAPSADVVIDPEASMRLNVAFSLMRLGLADQAHTQLTLGRQRAERTKQPLALALHHWAGGMVEARLEDTQAVVEHAVSIAKIVETTMLAQAALNESLRVARAQEAWLLELQTLTAFVEMEGSGPDNVAALDQVHQRITEGRDTPAYRRASAALAAKSAPP